MQRLYIMNIFKVMTCKKGSSMLYFDYQKSIHFYFPSRHGILLLLFLENLCFSTMKKEQEIF